MAVDIHSSNLPTDSSCTFASDRGSGRMLDCIFLKSIPALTFSSCPMDTWTLHSCNRQKKNLLPALALWSRFQMALANKFCRLFFTLARKKWFTAVSSSFSKLWKDFSSLSLFCSLRVTFVIKIPFSLHRHFNFTSLSVQFSHQQSTTPIWLAQKNVFFNFIVEENWKKKMLW